MGNDVQNRGRLRVFVAQRWRDALLAGGVFWLPDFLYHCFARSEPTSSAIWALTLIMPSAVMLAYFAGRTHTQTGTHSRAFSMLLGIWCVGPTMIMLGQSFEGAGFKNVQSIPFWLVASVFPPLALLMAGYDLSVFALLLATVLLVAMYWLIERRRKQMALHNSA